MFVCVCMNKLVNKSVLVENGTNSLLQIWDARKTFWKGKNFKK